MRRPVCLFIRFLSFLVFFTLFQPILVTAAAIDLATTDLSLLVKQFPTTVSTGSWLWEHTADLREPAKGYSRGRIESRKQNGTIQFGGQNVEGVWHLVFTPRNALFQHSVRLVGVFHDDRDLKSYPKVDIYLGSDGGEIIIEKDVVIKDIVNSLDGIQYIPLPYLEEGSKYVPELERWS
jgi:hypothetical protein